MNEYARSAQSYLAQRILTASPEQQAALIMEAGQRQLGKAIKAIADRNPVQAAQHYIRILDVLSEAALRLNQEDGGELAQNLGKLYDWWTLEIMEASRLQDDARLRAVADQMGEIRQAWEQLHEKKVTERGTLEFELGDRVV